MIGIGLGNDFERMSMSLSTKPSTRPEKLVVTYEPVGALRPQKRNPRKHDRKQVRQIADSMATLGVNTPDHHRR